MSKTTALSVERDLPASLNSFKSRAAEVKAAHKATRQAIKDDKMTSDPLAPRAWAISASPFRIASWSTSIASCLSVIRRARSAASRRLTTDAASLGWLP